MRRSVIVAGLAAVVVLIGAACTTNSGPSTPPNVLPVAQITTNPNPPTGQGSLTVTFDGSASNDPDGSITGYTWDFGDSTTGSGVSVTHTFGPGNHLVQLAVTDNKGAIGTASTTVSVTNAPPVADFTITPSGGAAGFTATFTSTSTDSDGTIDNYSWDFEELGTESGPTKSVVNKTIPAGTFDVTLTVTDNNGATATKTRQVTATGAPAAPVNLTKTGSGCCDTWADYSWTPVPGADGYEINMDGYFLGGCVTDHSAVINGQASTGRVQAVGLCLGSQYDVSIRAKANGLWGPWSSTIHITL